MIPPVPSNMEHGYLRFIADVLSPVGVTPSKFTLLKSLFLTIYLYFMGGGSEAITVIDTMMKMRWLVEQNRIVEQQRWYGIKDRYVVVGGFSVRYVCIKF